MKTLTGALTLQNFDNCALQTWLYPRVVEPISAGDWTGVVISRTVSFPAVPDSFYLVCYLVGERLTPWTAETFTHALNPLCEQGFTAQEALAVMVQRYFTFEEEKKPSLLVDLPWTPCGQSSLDLCRQLDSLTERPVWSLQSILLHWSRVGAPDDLLAITYQEQIPGRLWHLLLPPRWTPLDKIATYNAIVTPDRPPQSMAQQALAHIEQCRHTLHTVLSQAIASLPASEGQGQTPFTITPTDQYIWCKVDNGWKIVYQGKEAGFKDLKGMHYLHYLVHHPEKEFKALDLMALVYGKEGTEAVSKGESEQDILDPKYIKALKNKYEDLLDKLEEARENHDIEKQQEIEGQIHWIQSVWKKSRGLRGKSRTFPSNNKRPELAVYKAIKKAMDMIQARLDPLGKHLQESVKTGATFVYDPRSETPRWHA
jgi:hypothetical protein